MLKDDLIKAHDAIQAVGGSDENPVLADLRQQLTAAVDEKAEVGDKGLAHQVLVFANQLQDLCNRAKRRIAAAANVDNEALQQALTALKAAKEHIQSQGDVPDSLLNTIDKAIDNG